MGLRDQDVAAAEITVTTARMGQGPTASQAARCRCRRCQARVPPRQVRPQAVAGRQVWCHWRQVARQKRSAAGPGRARSYARTGAAAPGRARAAVAASGARPGAAGARPPAVDSVEGQEELCFINDNGTWYRKEPNFQYQTTTSKDLTTTISKELGQDMDGRMRDLGRSRRSTRVGRDVERMSRCADSCARSALPARDGTTGRSRTRGLGCSGRMACTGLDGWTRAGCAARRAEPGGLLGRGTYCSGRDVRPGRANLTISIFGSSFLIG
ncbi:hypothetical protein Bca52824_017896 [Brassica carinata]|uniref:Uncharacterized protein n=1 Tax=Brassica carinata TaxID=52824 RepID=A0A8X7VNG6_BRACI|nr:hypothetical protein Bca52824_017896 [Brassica carinata]